jgi:hypothetical protein
MTIPEGFFEDAANPTDKEIVRWAYIDGAQNPPEVPQDWQLCVAEPPRADLMVRLASDEKCPNRRFFLSCLYLLIGDAVRTNGKTWPLEEASAWLTRQTDQRSEETALFVNRARELLAKPETFDYKKWCFQY